MTSENQIKVLLIHPIPHDHGIRVSINPPHFGLACLGAYLLQKNIEVRIFDGELTPSYKKLKELVEEYSPTHAAITACTRQIKSANKAGIFIKELDSAITTIIGGVHASALPRETLQDFPGFDYLIQGEGEIPLYKLVTAKDLAKEAFNIDNLAFRDGTNIIVNKQGAYLELNELTFPAWHLFDLEKYKALSYREKQVSCLEEFAVQVSRGCPYDCTFCNHASGKQYRVRSIKNIIAEMKHLINTYPVKSIFFNSDTFTLNKTFVMELCQEIINENINEKIQWGCLTRIDLLDKDLLKIMKRSGCNFIGLGIESGNKNILHATSKGYSTENIRNKVAEIKAAGISAYSSFILGFPEDTKQSILETINFACNLDLDYATFAMLVPYPGTEVAKLIESSKQLSLRTRDWNEYDTQTEYLIKGTTLSSKEIIRLHRWAYIRFYFRRKHFLKLFKIVNLPNLTSFFFRKLIFFYKQKNTDSLRN